MSFIQIAMPHLAPWVMVLTRLTGLFVFSPILSSPAIPTQVRLYLALTVSTAMYPLVAIMLQDSGQFPIVVSMWILVPVLLFEFIVGVVIGFLAGLPLIGLQLGGLTVGQQLGLGLAREYNPALDTEGNIIGQIIFFMAIMAFLAIGGVEILCLTVLDTFENIPVGGFAVTEDLVGLVTGMIMSAYELAIRIAAPILCLIFLQTFALGFVSKTSPAFNIMSLGFPLRVILGSFLLLASIETIAEISMDEMLNGLLAIIDFFEVEW